MCQNKHAVIVDMYIKIYLFFSSEDSVDGLAGAAVFCLGDAPSVGCWRTPLESEADTAC